MKTNTMHLRLTVSASYDLSEVPEEDREEVREELRARLTDMPTFYAGQGDFTGDTEAELDEWDSTIEETPQPIAPGALAALVTAARSLAEAYDLRGYGCGDEAQALEDALAPFTPQS